MDKKPLEMVEIEILRLEDGVCTIFKSVGKDEDELPGMGEDIFE